MHSTRKNRKARPNRNRRAVFYPFREFAAAVSPLVPRGPALMIADKVFIELRSGRWTVYNPPAIQELREAFFPTWRPKLEPRFSFDKFISEVREKAAARKSGGR